MLRHNAGLTQQLAQTCVEPAYSLLGCTDDSSPTRVGSRQMLLGCWGRGTTGVCGLLRLTTPPEPSLLLRYRSLQQVKADGKKNATSSPSSRRPRVCPLGRGIFSANRLGDGVGSDGLRCRIGRGLPRAVAQRIGVTL